MSRSGTDRRFVVNTFLSLRYPRTDGAHQCTNLGVANCMGGLILVLDTPPVALSLLNDAGLTAFCHTDVSHTLPGVLLRWVSGKPSFVCNSHFPHHGVVTLAHCAAPRKMNGRDYEPTKIMTHYESDYGAATKVQYRKGQAITCPFRICVAPRGLASAPGSPTPPASTCAARRWMLRLTATGGR
jgi:hypothetical protein